MKILITMNIDPEFEDAGHPMGVTEDGYNQISEALCELGSDIEVGQA